MDHYGDRKDWRPMERHFEAQPATSVELSRRVALFKALLAKADKLALGNAGLIPEADANRVAEALDACVSGMAAVLGVETSLDTGARNRVGALLQQEFLPYLSMAETAGRFYSKPRGYAGDYLTIAKIYENRPSGAGRIGWLIDQCFLERPSAKAVRNRRHLLRKLIFEAMTPQAGATTRVTSFACGPAQEIFDTYEQLECKASLQVNLVDLDLQALAFVADKRDCLKLTGNIQLHNGNMIHLAAGRQKLPLQAQHFIYSVGLIDYFGDQLVVKLINFAYDLLAPGGTLVLGNFHPRNGDKALMDYVLDWKLIHRDEAAMHKLFAGSRFGKPADKIHFEAEGINLFAECVKPR